MNNLGERIREVYIDKYSEKNNFLIYVSVLIHLFRLKFLPDTFDEETMYVRSSDYIRTQESVQQLIAGGLYPENKRPSNFHLKLLIR